MNTEQIKKVMEENGISDEKIRSGIKAMRQAFGDGEIENFSMLNKGMTNRLFTFYEDGIKYLLRIPGEGTEYIIDRYQEAEVYQLLSDRNIAEKYVYLGAEDGIKIREFIMDAHVCDADNREEVRGCMNLLRSFHEMDLKLPSEFDVFEMMDEYEKELKHDPADFLPDYYLVRENMKNLKAVIEQMPREKKLCHIDPVPDNFLFTKDRIYLIDWEYAAMSDPHIDIAMFCVYAGYDKKQIDQTIDFYFEGKCPEQTRRKIYGYVAASGFLWSIWVEIKRDSGVMFEDYEEQQYHYASEFYTYVMEEV